MKPKSITATKPSSRRRNTALPQEVGVSEFAASIGCLAINFVSGLVEIIHPMDSITLLQHAGNYNLILAPI